MARKRKLGPSSNGAEEASSEPLPDYRSMVEEERLREQQRQIKEKVGGWVGGVGWG